MRGEELSNVTEFLLYLSACIQSVCVTSLHHLRPAFDRMFTITRFVYVTSFKNHGQPLITHKTYHSRSRVLYTSHLVLLLLLLLNPKHIVLDLLNSQSFLADLVLPACYRRPEF